MTGEPAVLPPERPAIDPRGFRVAAVRGVLAFLVLLLVAEVLAFLNPDATEQLSLLQVLKSGGVQFFAFHHAAVVVELSGIDLGGLFGGGGGGGPFGIGFSVSFAMAMLLMTVLALWLLYRGGRSAAAVAGGAWWHRLLAGASVAVPYALLSVLLAALSGFRVEVPTEAGLPPGASVEIGVSLASAFAWTLLLGALAGGLGGLAAARELIVDTRGRRWALTALDAGLRMVGVAMLVGTVVLFVLAAANPGGFVSYWEGVADAGVRGGLTLVLLTAGFAPNLIVFLGFLGMGGNLGAGVASSSAELSLFSFPSLGGITRGIEGAAGAALPGAVPGLPEPGLAPPEWWASILIPLAAVLWGGRWAARRVAATRAEGAAAGALAGAAFAVLMLGLAVLGGFALGFNVDVFLQLNNSGQVGPGLATGTLLALLWGVAGGALGGLLGVRRPPSPQVPPYETEGPPPPPPPPPD